MQALHFANERILMGPCASSLLRALRLALKWAQCGLVFNKLITILEKSQRLIMQMLY